MFIMSICRGEQCSPLYCDLWRANAVRPYIRYIEIYKQQDIKFNYTT